MASQSSPDDAGQDAQAGGRKLSSATSRRQTLRPLQAGPRQRLYDVIFEAETPAGRWFDIVLLIAILASITVVSLETVARFADSRSLLVIEWILTLVFTAEYVARLLCVRSPLRYVRSFWGLVDLLSFLPSYITLFVGGDSRSFVILRSVRLLRVFRVLKLWRMMDEAGGFVAGRLAGARENHRLFVRGPGCRHDQRHVDVLRRSVRGGR